MVRIKIYDKATDKQVATAVVNSMAEYKRFICTQIDHNKQYVFGVRF